MAWMIHEFMIPCHVSANGSTMNIILKVILQVSFKQGRLVINIRVTPPHSLMHAVCIEPLALPD